MIDFISYKQKVHSAASTFDVDIYKRKDIILNVNSLLMIFIGAYQETDFTYHELTRVITIVDNRTGRVKSHGPRFADRNMI